MARPRRAANGDGSIYQRDDKRWVGSFVADGKRKYIYGKTQKEAREKLRYAQQEHKQGTLVEPSKLTVKAYLTHWISIHGPTLKLTTDTNYRAQLEHHIIAPLGAISLQKLTPDQIQKCYAGLLEEGLQASTIHFIHTIFKSALADAVEWGKIARNPCSKVKLPRKEKRDIMPLTQEQAHMLLEVARGHWLAGVITLALATGMREGELLALHWQDIDFERGVLQVMRTHSYIPAKGHYESEPKTASSKRSLVLAPFALNALKAQRTAQRTAQKEALRTGAMWQDKGLVFCNAQGDYLWVATLHRAFKRILQLAGLPDIRFHDLRHTAAVALIMKGVHAKVISEILGHSSIKITMDIYGHVFPSMQRDAMASMDEFLTAM